jgi:adenosine deaminase
MDDLDYLHRLPKAELHCHLEGSIPAGTVIELARRNGVSLPTYDPEQLYRVAVDEAEFNETVGSIPPWVFGAIARKYQRPIEGPQDLHGLALYEAFLQRFDDVCVVLQTTDDFSRAVYDALTAAAAVNVRYREMFFHPMNHPGVRYRTMLDGLLDGIRGAETDHGLVGRLIPAINRDQSAAAGLELAEQVVDQLVPEVIGLASDYDEEHLPAFRDAYRIAANAGLPGTAHAGEHGTARSVQEAIETLGCTRIDHGYAVTSDPELMVRAADAGVHFAAIFSFSVAIADPGAWPLDPPALPPNHRPPSAVSTMLNAGLSVSLGSDDPSFEGFGSLTDEYVWAAGGLDLDRAQMTALCLAAVDGAWLDASDKAGLRRMFEAEIAALQIDRPSTSDSVGSHGDRR